MRKQVSILGDSISTYEGYNPEGYSVYYDKATQRKLGLTSVYDTWWAMVNQYLHAYLCVNNSYSGSKVTGSAFPAACDDGRLFFLRKSTVSPDLILIYLGVNDFGYGVPVKGDKGKKTNPLPGTFEEAYTKMLSRLKLLYPSTTILCGTLMRSYIRNRDWTFPEILDGARFEDYNDAIREACWTEGIQVMDLSLLGLYYESLDGTHPTRMGHKEIAGSWITCMKSALIC